MRVLLVEDDYTIAEAIKDGLEQESFAVDVEYDGESGYYAAASEDYDLLILDVLLPRMDGIEMVRRLRQDKNQARILILSAKDGTIDRITGLNTGADDYMIKPFSFEELLARIRALLRRPNEKNDEILNVQDLSLNTVTKEVRRRNTVISLSAKEYAILEYMLRNRNKVLSKDQIMSHVWNFDADILPHTVETFMTYLRAKIEKPFTGPILIHTIRGAGYKISDS